MKAMAITGIADLANNSIPLSELELDIPKPSNDEILLQVHYCGVCHTEIDEIEGRAPPSEYPRVPGHQVVGAVKELGANVTSLSLEQRVGVAWVFDACGHCEFCLAGNENLCKNFVATGCDVHGGYAEYMVAKAEYCYSIPEALPSASVAPLLCAGAIGYRSLRLANIANGEYLGLTGFGASAHLVLKMAIHLYPDSPIYVFARSKKEQEFALELGAVWAGDTADECPEKLHSIIDTTPAWKPVICALENLRPAGRLVINAIRKENADKDTLLKLDYPAHLWLEKEIKSVANVSASDVQVCLELAASIPLTPVYQTYALKEANAALISLKCGDVKGAKVLKMSE